MEPGDVMRRSRTIDHSETFEEVNLILYLLFYLVLIFHSNKLLGVTHINELF